MKYKCLIFFLSTCLFIMILYNTVKPGETKAIENLSGYIEIWFDYSIKQIDLSTGKSEEIFTKDRNINIKNFVIAFDVAPDGKVRVLSTTGSIDNPPRLLIYKKDDKSLKTIIEKTFLGYPSFSPDGKFIAYLFTPYKKQGINWKNYNYLYIIKTDGSAEKQIPKLLCDLSKPSWFPDGKKIAIGSKDQGISIIDVDTSTVKIIIDTGTTPSVSHQGKKIVYLSEEASDGSVSVLIYDIETKKTKTIVKELFTKSEWPLVWSPDDKYILYTDNKWEHFHVYALNIETGVKQRVTSLPGVAMGWR